VGAGVRPQKPSQHNVASGCGVWLSWSRANQDGMGLEPDRMSPSQEELGHFADYLFRSYARATVRTRIVCLERAVFVLDPLAPRDAYKRIRARLGNDDPSLRKRERLQSAGALIALGTGMMDAARANPIPPKEQAMKYRNGLQIALLAARPLRRKNFCSLRLGTHIHKLRGQWHMTVRGDETKNGLATDVAFPSMLSEYLDYYLVHIRSRLLNRATDALWISQFGGHQSEEAISRTVGRWTEKAFGQPINLHLFRDCAATSIAIEDPASINIVSAVLGHRRLAAGQKHYNQARSIDASRKFSAEIERLRRAHGSQRRRLRRFQNTNGKAA
jgi:integrase/recombinase XerD